MPKSDEHRGGRAREYEDADRFLHESSPPARILHWRFAENGAKIDACEAA
jgi:hypothetical protein